MPVYLRTSVMFMSDSHRRSQTELQRWVWLLDLCTAFPPETSRKRVKPFNLAVISFTAMQRVVSITISLEIYIQRSASPCKIQSFLFVCLFFKHVLSCECGKGQKHYISGLFLVTENTCKRIFKLLETAFPQGIVVFSPQTRGYFYGFFYRSQTAFLMRERTISKYD